MAAAAMNMALTISPSEMTSTYYPVDMDDIPLSPGSESNDDSSEKPKRKRKSWGQPIPDYQPILPPGKRAKTEEEKEQRRCERIVRNRKAAATSRDRKKHEFERLEMENKVLRQQLEQQQAIIEAYKSGQDPATIQSLIPAADPVAFKSNLPPTPPMSARNSESGRSSGRSSSPVESVVSRSNPRRTSPTLTPSLFMKSESTESVPLFSSQTTPQIPEPNLPDMDSLDSLPGGTELEALIRNTMNDPQHMLREFANFDESGETRYPAVVLCEDLQCLPESSERADDGNTHPTTTRWINSILVIQLVVLNAISNISSSKMLSAMSQILTSLEQLLPRLQSSPKTLDMIFPLIHSLITLPSKETSSRRAFRMAFLRRLLSSSPVSARLIDDATSRALQRLSSADAIRESSRDGLSWASLLTMRWAIRSILSEEDHYRRCFQISTTKSSASLSSSLSLSEQHQSHQRWDRSSGREFTAAANKTVVTGFAAC